MCSAESHSSSSLLSMNYPPKKLIYHMLEDAKKHCHIHSCPRYALGDNCSPSRLHDLVENHLGNGRKTVSRALFWKRELTEFCGQLGGFRENTR